ncbi:hypothetical protein MBLNU457_6763t1 [Dothideomycetes sp. NU457]
MALSKPSMILSVSGKAKITTKIITPPQVGWGILGPTLAVTFLATFAIFLRLYTRRLIIHKLCREDYLMAFCLLLSWANTSVIIAEHVIIPHAPPPEKMHPMMPLITRLVLTTNTLWVLTTCLTKTALLIQYLRLFPSPAPGRLVLNLRRVTFVLLFALVPTICWGLFGGLFICKPIQKVWLPATPGHCDNPEIYWLSVAALDVFLDFSIWAMPIPMVLGLQSISRREKAGLVGVFALGFSVCVVGLLRLILVHLGAREKAWTSSAIDAIVWSAVEMNVGLVCAGSVALKPLAVKVKNRLSAMTEPEGFDEKDEPGTRNGRFRRYTGSGSTLVASTRNDSGAASRKSKYSGHGRLDSVEDQGQLPPSITTNCQTLSSGSYPTFDEAICPVSPTSESCIARDFACEHHKKSPSQPQSLPRDQSEIKSRARSKSLSDTLFGSFRNSISHARSGPSGEPPLIPSSGVDDAPLNPLTPLNSHPRLQTVSRPLSSSPPPVIPLPVPAVIHDDLRPLPFHSTTSTTSNEPLPTTPTVTVRPYESRDSIAHHHARLAADRAAASPLSARCSISYHHARLAAKPTPKVARDSIAFHHARLTRKRTDSEENNDEEEAMEVERPTSQCVPTSQFSTRPSTPATAESDSISNEQVTYAITPRRKSSVAIPRQGPVTRTNSRSHNLYGEEFCGPGLGIFVDGDVESGMREALGGCAVPMPSIPDSGEIGKVL